MVRIICSLGFLGVLVLWAATTGMAADLGVSRVVVATGVEDREPVGAAETFSAGVDEIVCFSEVTGAGAGSEVVHVWYQGEVERARVTLTAEGERWRTWSRIQIGADQTGPWRVVVEGPDGTALGQVSFEIAE
jgi:hypothetical protein